MHAVFDAVPAVPRGPLSTNVGTASTGFLIKGIGGAGAASFFAMSVDPLVVLLILVLPFVDAGSQDHLSGTRLYVEPRKLQVARPRRPPQHGPDLGEILGSHREYRPSGIVPSHHKRFFAGLVTPTVNSRFRCLPCRGDTARKNPLYRPQRHLQP